MALRDRARKFANSTRALQERSRALRVDDEYSLLLEVVLVLEQLLDEGVVWPCGVPLGLHQRGGFRGRDPLGLHEVSQDEDLYSMVQVRSSLHSEAADL